MLQWALSSVEQSGGRLFWRLPPYWGACSSRVASSAPSAAAPQTLQQLLPLLVTVLPERRPRHTLRLWLLVVVLLLVRVVIFLLLLLLLVTVLQERRPGHTLRLWPRLPGLLPARVTIFLLLLHR
ncbi:expressed unknown protein [Ectocarpus siliculosus]|uniref:Uncharacterized protein n=1 Tax=Ectocarpus siliculosus TaxID=2880 RepID=D7FTX1_ECTSI|nr:expressed unknown protein [Ectocarpus siliculosus]|eukprot:CBJ31498.1 expressed unknown protein [Ectocarpus siliculosus]